MQSSKTCAASRCPMMIDRRGLLRSAGALAGAAAAAESDLDDVPDSGDTKGFHQLFIYGDPERQFEAYCKLAGIEVVHI